MKILCIGDIFGRPGREAIKALLPKVIEREGADVVIVNGENAAGGKGLTGKIAEELFTLPIDVLTAGNHIWEAKCLPPYFETHNVLRPLNMKGDLPGRGWCVVRPKKGPAVAVVSLQGEIFMEDKGPAVLPPFPTIDNLLPQIKAEAEIIVIDFHAEATSEKRALAWFLDGRVTACFGTHTHVQTADEEIMPRGTAYISDLGMTGPHASVIGLDKDIAIRRFLTKEPKGFKVATEDVRLEGVAITVDDRSGRALSIKRIRERLD